MKRIPFAVILATLLHADSQHVLRATFPDGTGLEIFTVATGSSQIDSEGIMGIAEDHVNRVVVDRGNNVLFAYNLEASRGADPNTVLIRIEPIRPTTESWMVKGNGDPRRPKFYGEHIPTVAGVREFPAVKIGEAVTLDILYNPSTGEKIFDVLRPFLGPTSHLTVSSVAAREMISLKDIAIRVDGHAMSAPAASMIGAAARIDIPGHGMYVVAAYDPHQAAPRAFAAVAHAEGKTLSWSMGGDRVEITSSTNILTRSESGELWVYRDPHYQPDVVGLQAADTVEWLLPRR